MNNTLDNMDAEKRDKLNKCIDQLFKEATFTMVNKPLILEAINLLREDMFRIKEKFSQLSELENLILNTEYKLRNLEHEIMNKEISIKHE